VYNKNAIINRQLLDPKIMKKQFTLSLFLAFFLLAPVIGSLAQTTAHPAAQTQGTWDAIGTVRAARMGGDHDVVTVPEPLYHYKKLKFKVTDAPMNIKKMVINYDNGESQTISNSYEVKKGGESNTIDLKAGTQKLKSVELWYDTKGLIKGKAKVTVMGMK
jgi:hypothetical protein